MHLFFGLGVYILDTVTDVIVVMKYYNLDYDKPLRHHLDSTNPPKLWLFYTFTFFLIVPLLVVNFMSLSLYIIGDLRLR